MDNDRWRQIDELFGRALEVEAEERDAFLKRRCGGDEDLERAVLRLLALEVEAASFLAEPIGSVGRTAEAPGVLNGARLGPYRLLRPLGHGGMGSVYLARREDDYQQKVAIKLLRRGVVGETARRQLRKERQILARLEHPNIARLYDGGTTAEGLPYLVMERVEGLPIDRFCDRHRPSIRRRLELFCEVCSAAAYPHRRRLVHCDLKPSNILITAAGTPKLLDFGIAKLLRYGDCDVETTLTWDGHRPVTPDYASPEQVSGQPITPASDVYSLGVLLYQLLCGSLPYRVTCSDRLEGDPGPPDDPPERPSRRLLAPLASQRSDFDPDEVCRRRGTTPQELARRLRGDLDAIAIKALRRDPADRYPTVEELERDIRRHLEVRPVSARRELWRYRALRLLQRLVLPPDVGRRHERLFWAATLIAVMASLALVSRHPAPLESTADPAAAAAGGGVQLVRLTGPAAGAFADAAPTATSAEVAAATAAQHLAEAREARQLCDYRLQRSAAVRAASSARSLGDEILVAQALLLEAEALDVLGRSSEADRALAEACEIFTRHGDRLGLARAALVLRNTVDDSRRPMTLEAALDVFRHAGDREGEALTLVRLGRWVPAAERERGEAMIQRGLAMAQDLGDLRIEAEAWSNLATLSYGRENLPLADERFATAVRLAQASGDASLVAGFMFNLAGVRAEIGNQPSADALIEQAVAISERIEHRYLLVMGLSLQADVLRRRGDESAVALLERAHRIALETGDQRLIGMALGSWVQELDRRGEHAQALAHRHRMLEIYESMGNTEFLALEELSVASNLLHLGHGAEAEARLRTLVERYPIDDEVYEHTALSIRLGLVENLLARDKLAQAQELLAAVLPRVSRKTEPDLHRLATRLAVETDAARQTTALFDLLRAEERRAEAAGEAELALRIGLDQGRMRWYAGDQADGRARFDAVRDRASDQGFAWIGDLAAIEADVLARQAAEHQR